MTRKKRAMQFNEYLWKQKQKKLIFIVSNTKHIEKKKKKKENRIRL